MRPKKVAQVAQPAAADPPPPDPVPAEPAPAEPAPAAAEPAPAVEQPLPVTAQPPVAEEPALTDEELAKLADQAGTEETITVTGSLIGRKEVDSPSPVSVVDKQKLEAAGITNVGDILQKIPAQGNAINAQNNNGGDGSVRINLRSLGANRTLVLMNGRRVVPSGTGADSSVDFGTIPLAMIERVEVLKDGASAIYGSDAVAGVVNVITRSNFNGTEASVYTSTSQKGDGNNYDLSFVTGHSSTKGNITFAGGYQEQKAVMAGDRAFAAKTYSYSYCTESKRAAGECHTTKTLSGSPSGVTGRINTTPNMGPVLAVPNCQSQFCTADVKTGGFRDFMDPDGESLGDNYNFQPLNYVFTPSTRINLFSTGGYDISKYAHAFYEGQFNSRKSTQQLASEPVSLTATKAPISAANFYNPFGTDVIGYQRRFDEFGPRTSSQEVNTTRLVIGLNGSVPETAPIAQNWKWEASYNYGRSNSTQTNGGNIIVSHLRNALGPTFMDADGGLHCGTSEMTEPAGCVPLSILTPNTVTPEMIDYLKYTGIRSGFSEQHTALATVSGKLIDLPNHGDISVALGGDFRKEEGGDQPDPLTATGDTTGNASVPTRGNYHVFEGFGELSIVPVSGLKYAKWVEIDAAARAYKYNTFGSGVTGKLSGLFRTAGGLAVRGTVGTLFRAPNVGELYAGASDSFPLAEDPCDSARPSKKVSNPTIKANCALYGVPDGVKLASSQQRAKLSGNPELTAEKGNVATAGVVYEPEPIPGLGITLDYWHINIDNAIQTLPVGQILSQCYQAGLPEFCALIQRNPSSLEIDYIFDTITNVGSLNTSGVDFAATYQYRTNYGTFRHALEGTYLFKYNINTGSADTVIHGRNFYDLGVNPDLKANLFTTWGHPSGLGAGFTARFVNRFYECDENNCNDVENGRRRVPRYATGDAFVNFGTKTSQGTTTVTLGVNNVVDAKPPVIYQGGALNSDESAYDFMGRQVYIRLSQLF